MSGGFDAFISYRRSDGSAVAQWLRRALVGYRPPKPLRAKYARPLRVYLDTSYERGAIDFYRDTIRPALLASRWLVVVATPDAVRRREGTEDWIAREVADFSAGPNGRNIVVVRGAGEFSGPLPADIAERFPNIEIVDLRGAARFSFLNPVRAARHGSEKLKLVAPLLDVEPADMPRLRQEEEGRQQVRLGAASGAVLGVLAVVTGVSVLAIDARNRAVRALEDSMFAVAGMALEASRLGRSNEAVSGIRDAIVNRGCDLVDKFREGALAEPPIAELVMCRIERARSREQLGEHDLARRELATAVEQAGDRHRRLARLDAAIALAEAHRAAADHEVRQKNARAAMDHFERLLGVVRRLTEQHSGATDLVRREAQAAGKLGDLFSEDREWQRAADSFDAAAASVARLVADRAPTARSDPPTLAWLARLHRLAGDQLGRLGMAEQALLRWQRAVEAGTAPGPEKEAPVVLYEVARARALTMAVLAARGETEPAASWRRAAIEDLDRIDRARGLGEAERRRSGELRTFVERRSPPQEGGRK